MNKQVLIPSVIAIFLAWWVYITMYKNQVRKKFVLMLLLIIFVWVWSIISLEYIGDWLVRSKHYSAALSTYKVGYILSLPSTRRSYWKNYHYKIVNTEQKIKSGL